MAKNMSTFAFLTCIIVIAVIFVIYQKKNRGQDDAVASTPTNEIERLAEKDLETGYPETPVAVMKLFGRINQCMYNTDDMKEEDFDALLNQMRVLYSTTLLDENSFEEQRKNLKEEIESFHSDKRKIVNYTVDKSSSVQYKKVDGQECAYLQMAYFMNEKGKYAKSFQNYVLVKEQDDWKILAFKKDETASQEEQQNKKENS